MPILHNIQSSSSGENIYYVRNRNKPIIINRIATKLAKADQYLLL